MVEPGALYDCCIMHRRPGVPRYRFVYRAYYLLLDLDHIDAACAASRLLSRNRFNLFAFHDRDHGDHSGGDLCAWARALLAEFGLAADGRIRLLCLPRVLGYVFNPISVYYCDDRAGDLVAVIAEVHNTFGERHCYVLHADGVRLDTAHGHDKRKTFHVSPLLERAGYYRFRLNRPGEHFALGIRLFDDDGRQLLGTALTGERRALSGRNLLALFLRIPLMTVKITAAIYWQALKIWLRGAPLIRKPAKRRLDYS